MRRRAAAVMVAAVATAGLLAGCGGSTTASSTQAVAARATTTATTQAAPAPKVSRRLRAQEAALHRQVTASLHHDSDASTRYGRLPADLRHRQKLADQVLSASAAHPADAIQGISVRLHLAHGSALATVVGPVVPTRIQGSADLHTSGVWHLTFSDVHGTVPITAKLFSITDEQGQLLAPRVSVSGGGALPARVPARRPFTLVLKVYVSVGDGKLRYAPAGGHWLSEWDFSVETD